MVPRWIRSLLYYANILARVPTRVMLLDWYHLARKGADLGSKICRGCVARARLLRRLYRRLWRGMERSSILLKGARQSLAYMRCIEEGAMTCLCC